METLWLDGTGASGAVGRRLEELAGASSRSAVHIRPRQTGFMLSITEWEVKWINLCFNRLVWQ